MMSGALEKFGIYDFMGIWGPGAITVTYYMFTLYKPIANVLDKLGITNPNISQVNLLIILYTAVAYVLGVILHETGKLLANLIPCFCPSTIKKLADYNGQSDRHGRGVIGEYVNEIESIIPKEDYAEMSFEKAKSNLKYRHSTSTKRIDTYHSAYALARSLVLCFGIHSGVEFVLLLSSEMSCKSAALIMLVDLILVFLFSNRTYRYYHSWIRNTFIQYFLSIPAKERKKRYKSNHGTTVCIRHRGICQKRSLYNLQKHVSRPQKGRGRLVRK